MPWAVCLWCDVLYQWRLTRGKRLKDIPCPKCGGDGKAISSPRDYYRHRERLKNWKVAAGK